MITAQIVRELRAKTGAGMMDCKKALQETDGDTERAVEILRKKGLNVLSARDQKVTEEGFIGSYNHGGRIGVIVEVNCETDFVAKNEEFRKFANDVALHIAAANPMAVSGDDLDLEFVNKEIALWDCQLREEGKPEQIIPKIIEGKLAKLKTEVCLMHQPYVKDTDKTISDLLNELVAKFGEKIVIRRFQRFGVGENIGT